MAHLGVQSLGKGNLPGDHYGPDFLEELQTKAGVLLAQLHKPNHAEPKSYGMEASSPKILAPSSQTPRSYTYIHIYTYI